MRKYLAALFLLIAIHAHAGTITITASGFATLPASAPPGWPSTVTWPGSQSPNGTKTYTITDANWQSLLTWVAASQGSIQGTTTSPSTPTAPQILLAWLQIWVNGTIIAVQQYFTTPASPPTPIVIQ